MERKFQFKRGPKSRLGKLSPAEMAFTDDEKKLYFGDGTENIRLLDQKDKTEITTQLADTEYQVNSEEALRYAIANGYTSIALKKDIVLNNPIHFDGVSIRFNLNGFKISLSDDYPNDKDYIFSIGYLETLDNIQGHKRTAKHIFDGFIDCNDKLVSVCKYYFSWDFKCHNLRVERCGLGFITYYPEAATLPTRGAEGILNNITAIASHLHDVRNIGFEIDFGDFTGIDLVTQGFSIGILNKGSGNKFKNCHPWGMPLGYSSNHRMLIGFADFGYNNYYIECISDTPELLDENLPASYENGGIGFYSQNSIGIRYNNCDVLVSSGSKDNSLFGWYFNKPSTLEDRYYGNGVSISVSLIRGPFSKLKKPIYFTGGRALPLFECNFTMNNINNQYTSLNAHSTVFKTPNVQAEDDIKQTALPDTNAFKIININGIMCIIYNDEANKQFVYYIRPYLQNSYYETTGLAVLRDKLKAEKLVNGAVDRTGTVTTILKKWNDVTSIHERFLVFWDRDEEKFFYAKDGTEVIF